MSAGKARAGQGHGRHGRRCRRRKASARPWSRTALAEFLASQGIQARPRRRARLRGQGDRPDAVGSAAKQAADPRDETREDARTHSTRSVLAECLQPVAAGSCTEWNSWQSIRCTADAVREDPLIARSSSALVGRRRRTSSGPQGGQAETAASRRHGETPNGPQPEAPGHRRRDHGQGVQVRPADKLPAVKGVSQYKWDANKRSCGSPTTSGPAGCRSSRPTTAPSPTTRASSSRSTARPTVVSKKFFFFSKKKNNVLLGSRLPAPGSRKSTDRPVTLRRAQRESWGPGQFREPGAGSREPTFGSWRDSR